MAIFTVFLALSCLFSGWPDVSAQGTDRVTIEKLRENLQSAIELEWATIPPYLNAALSIKEGTNKPVNGILWSILGNEMDHMALAANMLNAIKGKPVLNAAKAPRYPGPLPAGCLPDLNVTLEKMTRAHTERVFMGIETPECEDSVTKFHDHLSKAASPDLQASNKMSEKVEDAFPGLLAKCDEEGYSPDTIGAIYIHKILCPMYKLEIQAQGSPEGTIFTGDPGRQVSIPFKVSNLTTAIRAIAFIISQGEGGDACNPYVDDQFAENNKKNVPSHYFKFAEIVHGKAVEYGGKPCRARDPWCHDYFSPCDGKNCENDITFNGPQVPFDENDVWPIISNPSTDLYPPGSEARKLSDDFNKVYVDVMQCLHDALNGHPEKLKPDCADDKMVDLKKKGIQLVQTPIYPGGPNASPTYEFDYKEKGQQQQQQQRIEL
ncbi:uncharacterized protein LOC118432734 [Branchiostoma floridae]|uniref:Uncharacterized protein LOC118432734 n=1 Tax=Branchiostoma floridae TaxID=7739 RepID=A0A9J7ND28_BRAFL|nr:uncharacterized protein LOC118432734 [Branchiostoma floridae]